MPLFDNNLMLRTTGNLTGNESVGPVTLKGGTKSKGLAVRVQVPAATSIGADDTLLAKVYASYDGSTYNVIAQWKKGATKVGASGYEMIVPFAINSKVYVKVELLMTATTTNFGAVQVGIVQNVGYEWDRNTHFS